jgi:hypothetical protein
MNPYQDYFKPIHLHDCNQIHLSPLGHPRTIPQNPRLFQNLAVINFQN